MNGGQGNYRRKFFLTFVNKFSSFKHLVTRKYGVVKMSRLKHWTPEALINTSLTYVTHVLDILMSTWLISNWLKRMPHYLNSQYKVTTCGKIVAQRTEQKLMQKTPFRKLLSTAHRSNCRRRRAERVLVGIVDNGGGDVVGRTRLPRSRCLHLVYSEVTSQTNLLKFKGRGNPGDRNLYYTIHLEIMME